MPNFGEMLLGGLHSLSAGLESYNKSKQDQQEQALRRAQLLQQLGHELVPAAPGEAGAINVGGQFFRVPPPRTLDDTAWQSMGGEGGVPDTLRGMPLVGDTRKIFLSNLLEAQNSKKVRSLLSGLNLGADTTDQPTPPTVQPQAPTGQPLSPGQPGYLPYPTRPQGSMEGLTDVQRRLVRMRQSNAVRRWEPHVTEELQRRGRPELFDHVMAMITQESGGNPAAISSAKAQGLMQVVPGTWAMYGRANPFDPTENIATGIDHLIKLEKYYNGDLNKATLAYHSGEGNVDKGNIGPAGRAYVPNILAMLGPQPAGNAPAREPTYHLPTMVKTDQPAGGVQVASADPRFVPAPQATTSVMPAPAAPAAGSATSPTLDFSVWLQQNAPGHVRMDLQRRENEINVLRRKRAEMSSIPGKASQEAQQVIDQQITAREKQLQRLREPYEKSYSDYVGRPQQRRWKAEDLQISMEMDLEKQRRGIPLEVEKQRLSEEATRPGELAKKEAEQRMKPLGVQEEKSLNELLRLDRAYQDIQSVLDRNRHNQTFLGGLFDEHGSKLRLDQAIERFKAGQLRNLSEDEERLLGSLSVLTSLEIHELAGSAQTANELARLTGAFGQLPDVWNQTPKGFEARLEAIGRDISDKLETKALHLGVTPVGQKIGRAHQEHVASSGRREAMQAAEKKLGRDYQGYGPHIMPDEVRSDTKIKPNALAFLQEGLEKGTISQANLVGFAKSSGYSMKDPGIQWLMRTYGKRVRP